MTSMLVDSVRNYAALKSLTPRQTDVMVQLVLTGAPADDLAKALGITRNSLNNHLKQIFNKLEVGTRTEVLSKFIRDAWIWLEESSSHLSPEAVANLDRRLREQNEAEYRRIHES